MVFRFQNACAVIELNLIIMFLVIIIEGGGGGPIPDNRNVIGIGHTTCDNDLSRLDNDSLQSQLLHLERERYNHSLITDPSYTRFRYEKLTHPLNCLAIHETSKCLYTLLSRVSSITFATINLLLAYSYLSWGPVALIFLSAPYVSSQACPGFPTECNGDYFTHIAKKK